MGWLDNILGKKEEPKKEKKKSTKKTATKKETKKAEPKKDQVLKGPEKKKANPKPKSKWTKGKLDQLSTSELHKVAKEHGVDTKNHTKTQIQSLIVKG